MRITTDTAINSARSARRASEAAANAHARAEKTPVTLAQLATNSWRAAIDIDFVDIDNAKLAADKLLAEFGSDATFELRNDDITLEALVTDIDAVLSLCAPLRPPVETRRGAK